VTAELFLDKELAHAPRGTLSHGDGVAT
jgi:hypothetical protein